MLMAGGGLFETGSGGSAPKHVEQFLPRLVRRDDRALHADPVPGDRMGRVARRAQIGPIAATRASCPRALHFLQKLYRFMPISYIDPAKLTDRKAGAPMKQVCMTARGRVGRRVTRLAQ